VIEPTTKHPSLLVPILIVGVLAMSSASILIRFARLSSAPSLVIAAYRLTTATLVLTIPVLSRRNLRELAVVPRHTLWLVVLSGGFLALHFAAWITSLDHTSVMSSVVLVTTTPIWIALAAPFLLGEHTGRSTWIGMLVAIAGGIFIGLSDAAGESPLTRWGDLLALAGAIFGACYLMIGRFAQRAMTLVLYLWLVYGIAAIFLVAWCVVAGLPLLSYSLPTIALMVAVGLLPQLIGHSAANYALRHVPASLVGVITLGEPIGSTILAVLLLNEQPLPLQLFGAILILLGIAFSISRQESMLPNGAGDSVGS